MKEFLIKYRRPGGFECVIEKPTRVKLLLWLLRYARQYDRICIIVVQGDVEA